MINKRIPCRNLEHAREHLSNALDTPDPEEKDLHIRLAATEIKSSLANKRTRKEDNANS